MIQQKHLQRISFNLLLLLVMKKRQRPNIAIDTHNIRCVMTGQLCKKCQKCLCTIRSDQYCYRHCEQCDRCVAMGYKHCNMCNRCHDTNDIWCEQCKHCIYPKTHHCDQCGKCVFNDMQHCTHCHECADPPHRYCNQCGHCVLAYREHCKSRGYCLSPSLHYGDDHRTKPCSCQLEI